MNCFASASFSAVKAKAPQRSRISGVSQTRLAAIVRLHRLTASDALLRHRGHRLASSLVMEIAPCPLPVPVYYNRTNGLPRARGAGIGIDRARKVAKGDSVHFGSGPP